jgi:hypothetical protein
VSYSLRPGLRTLAALMSLGTLACDSPATVPAEVAGARRVPPTAVDAASVGAPILAANGLGSTLMANGSYHFLVPADFNGGIFGVAIGNDVSFTVRRSESGQVTGRFRYVQSAEGESFIFSGTVTCLALYDTPVLVHYPDIPPGIGNRAKWGGVIEASNDPTLPAGTFIWFQSIDNTRGPGTGYPDLSTLSGFGTEAANEAFCASPNVPNPNFGPHPVDSGNILVQ